MLIENLPAFGDNELLADRYRLIRSLGSGAMGWVVLAEDTRLQNQDVALKLLFPHLFLSDSSYLRFRQETTVAMRLAHPNVVQTYGMGVTDDLAYIAMEYVVGCNLKEQLQEHGPPSVEVLQRWLFEILQGLHYAHNWGIIHRDLKSDNILLDSDRSVKVADFGVAQLLKNESAIQNGGGVVGTPYYMSPEQIRNEALDPRADIYSFGILAYELLVGTLPFEHSSLYGLAKLHLESQLPEITTDCPQWIKQLIAKCCAKERSDRFDTAAEICQLIEIQTGMEWQIPEVKNIEKRWNLGEEKASGQYRLSRWLSKSWAYFLLIFLVSFFPMAAHFNSSISRESAVILAKIEQKIGLKLPLARLAFNFDGDMGDSKTFFSQDYGRRVMPAKLAAGVDPNFYSTAHGQYPVHYWVQINAESELTRLLEAGARLDVLDALGRTPLDIAIENRRVFFVDLLLEWGAPVNFIYPNGETPLLKAVTGGSFRVAAKLLHAGADPNLARADGQTALQIAVRDSNPQLSVLLIKYGARTDVRDSEGRDLLGSLDLNRDASSLPEQQRVRAVVAKVSAKAELGD